MDCRFDREVNMENRFYVCKHCGNLIGFIKNSGVPVICCGEPMSQMRVNSVDASAEKHIPIAKRDGDNLIVTVGEVEHPMTEQHYIEWIYLETVKGGQRKLCVSGPRVTFALAADDMPVAAYAYCNLHGLWRKLL